jgi:hypothetical protein
MGYTTICFSIHSTENNLFKTYHTLNMYNSLNRDLNIDSLHREGPFYNLIVMGYASIN